MKILVTGGAGFIGSHLVERALVEGHEVVCLDNLSVGRRKNIEAFLPNNKFSFFQCDVSQLETIEKHFEGIDWVFHLAARADIVPSIQMPQIYHQANVDGTINVLESARKAKVKRFVYAASSSCYGIPEQYPTPETASISPKYPYALTKYLGECYVLHWAQVYKMPALSLRFFNVFGPRARTSGTYGAVFGVFLAQKLNGKPLTVVGDGSQTRDFTYVTDAVSALWAAASSSLTNDIFNVGSGGTYSVNELVELLDSPTINIPKRPGEPDCTFADISKIKAALRWEPKMNFQEGVKQMLENLENWKDAPLWNADSISKATEDWFKYLSN